MPFKNFLFVTLAVAIMSACTPTSQDGLRGSEVSSSAVRSPTSQDGLSGAEVSSSAIRTPYSMTISTEQARVGNTSQRFEVRHGDCYFEDCESDRRRVEYQQPNSQSNRYVGRTVWYGWSVYLPANFTDLSPTNTIIGQVHLSGWRDVWQFNLRDAALLFGVNDEPQQCRAISLSNMKGRWTDIVVMAHYSTEESAEESIGVWINGNKVCARSLPLLTDEMLRASSNNALRFKYGIYNSYISRWLQRNATQQVESNQFQHVLSGGHVINSVTATPYDYDWGVELPTQVVFYDEVRVGLSREEVDLRLRLQ